MALLDTPDAAVAPARPPGLGTLPQVRTAALAGASFVAVTVAHVAHAAPVDGLLVAAVLVVVAACLLPLRHVVVVATTGWALVTGFVVNAGGQLTDHGPDLVRLAVLVAVAVVARAGATEVLRSGRRH
jgi:hypothetical protein